MPAERIKSSVIQQQTLLDIIQQDYLYLNITIKCIDENWDEEVPF